MVLPILEPSLIGALEVKRSCGVFRPVPAGYTLLFAVGAEPPHDGVSPAWFLDLFHDLAASPRAQDSQRGGLTDRHRQAWGNINRLKDGGLYGLDSILADMDEALAALRVIDPQDAVLRKADEQQSKWWKRLNDLRSGRQGQGGEDGVADEPDRMPIRTP